MSLLTGFLAASSFVRKLRAPENLMNKLRLKLNTCPHDKNNQKSTNFKELREAAKKNWWPGH